MLVISHSVSPDISSSIGFIDFPSIPEPNGVKLNITIHKQIIDHLEESGTSGMTLNVSFSINPALRLLIIHPSTRNFLRRFVNLTSAQSSFS